MYLLERELHDVAVWGLVSGQDVELCGCIVENQDMRMF